MTGLNRLLILIVASALPLLSGAEFTLPRNGLILDLDADKGIKEEGGAVLSWRNQVEWKAMDFEGRRADGRPSVRKSVDALRGHSALIFKKQELVNYDDDAFDHLITGNGYTWLAVIAAYKQNPGLKDVNSFFGNLKNSGMYEGFWGCLNDDNSVWIGSRNSTSFGRWNADNPKVQGPVLEEKRFYIIAGRMGSGPGSVTIDLFVNEAKPAASLPFPVNPKANASRMAIGQERDATNHPGKESFEGEIARMLIWERPLSDAEMAGVIGTVKENYGVK